MAEGFLNPYELVREFGLKKGMSVADFGSGAGHFSLAMANEVGKDGKVNAIDIRPSVLSVLEGHAKLDGLLQIKTIHGNVEKEKGSTLSSNSQDVVLCSNIVHQAEKPDAVFHEAYRVLRPEGRLIVVDWTEESNSFGPSERVAQKTVEDMAAETGFGKEDELINPGTQHYGVIFRKEK